MAVRLSALRAGRPPITPRKIPGTHFSQRPSRLQGHSTAARIRSIEKSSDLIGNRTRGIPSCNIVPQPTTPPFRKHNVIQPLNTMLNVSVSCGGGRVGIGCKVRLGVSLFHCFRVPVSMVVSVLAAAERQRNLDKLGLLPLHPSLAMNPTG
jgi:hypothetical protein